MKNIGLSILLLGSVGSFAGSGPAVIECNSASGRTKVNFVTQNFSNHGELFSVTIDGNSMDYHSVEENVTSPDVLASLLLFNYDLEKKILSVVAQKTGATGKEFYSALTAVPSTIKIVKKTDSSIKLTFTGLYRGLDPRSGEEFFKEGETFEDTIHLDCQLNYEI